MPKRPGDCWLGLMHELQRLRLPPLFTHKHRNVELSQGGAVATKYSGPSRGDGWCAAVVGGLSVVGSTSGDTTPKMHQCGVRMRAGRHFVQFSQCGGRQKNFFVGLIQPDSRSVAYRWDLQKDSASCFYHDNLAQLFYVVCHKDSGESDRQHHPATHHRHRNASRYSEHQCHPKHCVCCIAW